MTISWDTADFEGAAHLFFLGADYERLRSLDILSSYLMQNVVLSDRIVLNLLITGVNFTYADFDSLDPHIGDTFSHHFFGKSPIQLNVKAQLIDTAEGFGKAEFTELYKKVFRISAVAKNKVAPILSCIGCMAKGAFLNAQITENSNNWETLSVNFEFLVFNMKYSNELEVNIDYNHAMNIWDVSKAVSPQAAGDPEIHGITQSV